ncbi:class I SAM-dependent methyltransferase [Niabella drilacis]|uniref:Methyltransferase domain-containing protein n=1 Tax=Niabella drilacis (strain DSM 25811 / CCM 8410 / CCUG 62505 / LMG 26954 / E90) TaxID=1285928 RepID=A0A1G6VZK2_NIADE|nr:class I SAM-dependent methyltransferase [Niabella drilacis]SDD58215.1 Methyltransferase domain-containing protein [Niabella drilacis]
MNIGEAKELIAGLPLSPEAPLRWADLGCGSGTFTHALYRLLPPASTVYAFDTNRQTFHEPGIRFVQLDFETQELPVPPLSGILMANSLHYISDPQALITRLRQHLEPGGALVLVEYDTNAPNRWVPFPVPLKKAKELAALCGFKNFHQIGNRPSIYHGGGMYAAVFI